MRVLWVGVAVAGLVGLFVWAFTPSVEEVELPPLAETDDPTSVPPTPSEPPSSEARPSSGRTDSPNEDGEAEAPAPVRERESESSGAAERTALTGLQMEVLSESELRAAGVPKRFKGGMRITRVHPDSSAAEVALEKGDIIVRAQTTDVADPQDLAEVVLGREYTRITFVREGHLVQAILKPPFVPKESRRDPN